MQLKTVLTIAYDLIFCFCFKVPIIRFLIFELLYVLESTECMLVVKKYYYLETIYDKDELLITKFYFCN